MLAQRGFVLWFCVAATLGCDASDDDAYRLAGDDGRTAEVHVPKSAQPGQRLPLVMVLHGYSATGALMESFLGLKALAETKSFIYMTPNGTEDPSGTTFWNASEACCDLFGSGVDDAGFLNSLVNQAITNFPVDPQRIYYFGHSNGGFMSHRMACQDSGRVSAIVSVAGVQFTDPARCAPTAPVGVLQVHGTADDTIDYLGGDLFGTPHPGAQQTIDRWVALDGCSPTATPGPMLDIETELPGAETRTASYGQCNGQRRVELWTIEGAGHVPTIAGGDFTGRAIDFLFAHKNSLVEQFAEAVHPRAMIEDHVAQDARGAALPDLLLLTAAAAR